MEREQLLIGTHIIWQPTWGEDLHEKENCRRINSWGCQNWLLVEFLEIAKFGSFLIICRVTFYSKQKPFTKNEPSLGPVLRITDYLKMQ